ncbi:NAD(P)-dependent oxidoreductase [Oceanispirochaeta sp.]|jgi:D-3-phosphoglycerate dehydrogenase|uniref:NAD(P)-dependent oxidoreductase n=1 Tax=Oceanispirochaeta sp. TaxID=2035350 RepID=UPI0026075923|nr:NAD(P)-dependent oxidoreductase [Oceanispirochaeta sp.]MDA3955309.1 NAD(P)-dependent oxidoreductase [Oceanispirochaeta sp.]
MNVLIADKLSDSTKNDLEALGASIRFEPGLTAEDLPAAVGDAEILIVRSTKVTRETIEKGESLSLIIRAGAGVNTIDLEEASSRGIHVANCPGKNSDAVAELAMGLIIAADRRIADATMDLRQGVWNKKLYGNASGLKDRTLSIIGMGSIGRGTADRGKAFGMKVAAWSRSMTPEKAKEWGVDYCSSPEEAASRADVLSIHLAAGKDTTHSIGKKVFDSLKEGAIFVNTSRGEVVDTPALKEAIQSKGIKAALDVYENEPGATDKGFNDSELAALITGTHHIGASTDQASEAIASEVVRIVQAYRDSGKPLHQVNSQDKSLAHYNLVVRHYNRVGVLAAVLGVLRIASINIEEMENSIFSGSRAAVCTLKLDDKPSKEVMEKIRAIENLIQAVLK